MNKSIYLLVLICIVSLLNSFVGRDPNGANLRVIWDDFCGLKFSSRGVVL